MPVAANCWLVPSAKFRLGAVTDNDKRIGCPTLRVADALKELYVAEIVAVPEPVPLASPLLLMVAMVVGEAPQFTPLVKGCVLPSL